MSATASPVRAGVDVGGTFTDLVAVRDGVLVTAKVASTPHDQSLGVHDVLAAGALGASVALAHGTTVATNALLERRGARVGLVTTEGFRDIVEIGRQNRPSLYDLTERRPEPLVPRHLRFTVRERMGPSGVVTPLDEASVAGTIERLRAAEVDAVAICLLFSFLDPTHEDRVAALVRAALPSVHISVSSQVLPEFREYERLSTPVTNAFLAPEMVRYLERLEERVLPFGARDPLVMQSSGGVIDVEGALERPVACVLSGPAGGAVGAAYVAEGSGVSEVLTLDMGGTSADVATVVGSQVLTTTESVVAGAPIRLPMLDVHTISAGGGSIVWVDDGGALRVGPRSAGADPGPACYARGGQRPTLTDINMCLGYLRDGASLGESITLDRRLAETTVSRVAAVLGLGVEETAHGVRRVANQALARALRVVSVERGLDPRDFALVAFGGAGGMHGCETAEELGVDTVLVPKAAGVLSALGLAIGDLRQDHVVSMLGALRDRTAAELERAFAAIEQRAARQLPGSRFRRLADLRYRHQSFELTVDVSDLGDLEARFHRRHEERYGYAMPIETIDVVNLRVVATRSREPIDLTELPGPEWPDATTGRASFSGKWRDVACLDRAALGAGSRVQGPAIVEFAQATTVVPPGWAGRIDDIGTLVLTRRP